MWYDTKFGRAVSQFAPGSVVVCDQPRCRVRIARLYIWADRHGQFVKYTSNQGNVYEEIQLWKSLDDLRALRRENYLRGNRRLTVGKDVFPISIINGMYFMEKATVLERITIEHAPKCLGNEQNGRGWEHGVRKVFHCSDGNAWLERGVFETYVEALRACARGNDR